MIQVETLLDSADNSGAKKMLCIKVLGGSRRRYARVGDIIKVSVKEAVPNSKVKKGDVLCIVEAMKSMNEIQSDESGEIREVCIKNAELVEFGQVLFKIDTSA